MVRLSKSEKTWILFGIVFAVAMYFRFWQMTEYPPGLYPDEAVNGVNGLQAVETGNYQVFYPDNNGREGLWMNIQGLVSKALGPSAWALRFPSMVVGILTVLGFFLLGRQLFSDEIALVSAALLATSFWHTVFSRIGFRAILLPLVLVWLFYFFVRGLKRGKVSDFAFAGFFFGLGFHTYISYRVVPLLFLVLLGVLLWLKRRKIWPSSAAPSPKLWSVGDKASAGKHPTFCVPCAIGLMAIVAIVVALPMILYLAEHPEDISGRTGGISVLAAENPLKALGISTLATLQQFNGIGDRNWRHNFPGRPELFWPVGIMMIVGLAIAVRHAFEIFRLKPSPSPPEGAVAQNHSSILVYYSGGVPERRWLVIFGAWLMLGWFFALMVPAILSREGLPHALRTIGTIPPAYYFAGIGTWCVWRWARDKVCGWLEGFIVRDPSLEFLRPRLARIQRWFIVLLLAFLGWVAVTEHNTYFLRWAPSPAVSAAFAADKTELANYISTVPVDVRVYVVVNAPSLTVNGISLNAQPLVYLLWKRPNVFYVTPETLDQIPRDLTRAEIILLDNDRRLLGRIKDERFPQAKTRAVSGTIVPLMIP